MRPKFVATQNKGFGIPFQNRFGVSVQWGTGNYCEKKNLGADSDEEMKTPRWESTSAEIAVFSDTGIVPVGDSDDVIGWCSADEVAKVIAIVSSTKDLDKMKEKIKALDI